MNECRKEGRNDSISGSMNKYIELISGLVDAWMNEKTTT
jgi:hypothetical protein